MTQSNNQPANEAVIAKIVHDFRRPDRWDHSPQELDFKIAAAVLAALRAKPAADGWQPIETAPKDGSLVLLLSAPQTMMVPTFNEPPDATEESIYHPPRANLGYWSPEGTSWIDENGQLNGDCYELAVTGVWDSGGGWFQPNEVTHWAPTPKITAADATRQSR